MRYIPIQAQDLFLRLFVGTMKKYSFRGQRHSLRKWSKILGIPVTTLERRMEMGWEIEDVLSVPPRKKVEITVNDMTLRKFCEEHGLDYKLISSRIQAGMPIVKAIFHKPKVRANARNAKLRRSAKRRRALQRKQRLAQGDTRSSPSIQESSSVESDGSCGGDSQSNGGEHTREGDANAG